ncbi:protein of unknown function; putative exported protein [Methylorubrum extorquens DM4]|uniref:Uncharacterized protein n=1 Tax=Methylorubrum extorquens (strain DSM 6343 / CIP 106787 / DM4) TaxID=661410 RepID=C7CEP7_METED|nr:hypothetical protein [Methylorubrum extorquens]CAX25999.1 protein of unknown function; putative exported protein [Methylorubrum extorquens DM4]
MTFRASAAFAMMPANQVGVAIQVTSRRRGLMHVGLLYEDRQGKAHLAHLKRDDVAVSEPAPNDQGFFWDDCAWLSRPNLNALAETVALFIELCARTREIPYGPNPPPEAFDAQGRYVCTDRRYGLTCATYVSAVLAGAGYPVVKFDTWQGRPDDETWWEMAAGYLPPARAEELEEVRIKFRLRPDEVAVAAAAEDRPLCFTQATDRSGPLRDILRRDPGSPNP